MPTDEGESPRIGEWFQTYTGLKFYPADPRVGEIVIEDIAHALAHLCRFAGHTKEFYSVAQHSVIVSNVVPAPFARWGLMHDAPEAYLVDLPRPLKHLPGMAYYRTLENNLERLIARRFNLPREMPECVKEADVRVLHTERRDLLHPGPAWSRVVHPLHEVIEPWSPREAESKFLTRFEDLKW